MLLAMLISTAIAGVREREYSSSNGLFVRKPSFEYPLEARRTHQTGAGRITGTKMLQSRPRREIDMPVWFQMAQGRQMVPPTHPHRIIVREFTE